MFDRCVCLNLDRRPERWEAFQERFPADWPWTRPERWSAIDGKACDIPAWHLGPAGAWGCLRSHLAIWRWQAVNGFDSVLVLEDDAVFSRNAVETIRETMNLLPADWDQVYFGGQHLGTNDRPPEAVVQDKLVRCRNVNRTHAYAIRLGFAAVCHELLSQPHPTPDSRLHHVDYRLGELHDQYNVYAPWRFCVGQVQGFSDVRSRNGKPARVIEHWWNQFPIVEPAGVR